MNKYFWFHHNDTFYRGFFNMHNDLVLTVRRSIRHAWRRIPAVKAKEIWQKVQTEVQV